MTTASSIPYFNDVNVSTGLFLIITALLCYRESDFLRRVSYTWERRRNFEFMTDLIFPLPDFQVLEKQSCYFRRRLRQYHAPYTTLSFSLPHSALCLWTYLYLLETLSKDSKLFRKAYWSMQNQQSGKIYKPWGFSARIALVSTKKQIAEYCDKPCLSQQEAYSDVGSRYPTFVGTKCSTIDLPLPVIWIQAYYGQLWA